MSKLIKSGGICEPLANGRIYYSFIEKDGETVIAWQPKPWKRAALKPDEAKLAKP